MPLKHNKKADELRSARRWLAEDEATAAYVMSLLDAGTVVDLGTKLRFDRMHEGRSENVQRIVSVAILKRANELLSAKRATNDDHGVPEGAA